jgi:hypothetical protein
MKRTARRQDIQLSSAQLAKLRKPQDAILVEEKADLSRKSRVF